MSEGKMVDYPVPRALEKSELPSIVEGFVQGAKNAMQAGPFSLPGSYGFGL